VCWSAIRASRGAFLAWWIDPESGLPIPERAGALRYFIRIAERIVWADQPEELMHDLLRGQDLPPRYQADLKANCE
jgi:hypothetical protein